MAVFASVLTETQRATLEALCDTIVPAVESDTGDPVERDFMTRAASDMQIAAQIEGAMADTLLPEEIAQFAGLLDALAGHDAVHRVATGRVKPRMGTGRPVAPISKVRTVRSGLSITINTDGAVIDAYVITDRPDEVAAFMRERGWTRK